MNETSVESASGVFVVFEGGDSVGKSTQVHRLAAWLTGRGRTHLVTRQPGGTEIGVALRTMILDTEDSDISYRAEALLYAADKAQHVHEVIHPALLRGEVVVCDRYVDSMIAYQGAGRELGVDEVTRIAWWAVGELRPDLTVLLDADPVEAMAAIARKDRLEDAGIELHQRARQLFLDLACLHPDRYLVLDARRSRDDLAAQVAARVEQLLTAG